MLLILCHDSCWDNLPYQEYATISYCVPGYFESPNPSVNIYASSPITAHKLNEEVLFLIPDPSQTLLVDEVEFLDVSGKKLSLVVLPPGQKFRVENDGGVKVIFGKRMHFCHFLSSVRDLMFGSFSDLGRYQRGPPIQDTSN